MEYRCHSYIRVTRAVNCGWLCFREPALEVIGRYFPGRTQDCIEAVSICMTSLWIWCLSYKMWTLVLEKVDILGFNWLGNPWIHPGIVSWMIHFFGFSVGQPGTFLGYWVSPEWDPSSSKPRKRQNGILFWSLVFWLRKKMKRGIFRPDETL